MPATDTFPGYDYSACSVTTGPGSSCAEIDALQNCLLQACLAGCGGTCSVVTTGGAWLCDGNQTRPEGYYACSCFSGSAPDGPCAPGSSNPNCGTAGGCGDLDCDGSDDCDGSPSTCLAAKYGTCTHTAIDCTDNDACNGTETCDPADGSCQPGTPLVCEDNDTCTDDGCNPATGCNFTPVLCQDGNECTDDDCDPDDGCTYTPNDDPCDDGDPCTINDQCESGSCLKSDPKCDDAIDCTTDSCDSDNGGDCNFVPNNDQCDDGLFCNGPETCDPDTGCAAGDAPDCDDGAMCTYDVCSDAQGQCMHQGQLDKCPCEGTAPSYSFTFNKEFDNSKVACPIIGGVAGFDAGAEIEIQAQEAHCSNDCTSSLGAKGKLTSGIYLCKESLVLEGNAYLKGSKKSCPDCDGDTCKRICKGDTCDSYDFGGGVKATYTKFYGYHKVKKSGPVSLEIKCGASLSGAPSLSLNGNKTKDQGYQCGTCTDCLSGNGTLGFGVAGDIGCHLSFDLYDGWYKKTIGCKSCGHIGLDVYGGVQGQTGECGGDICAFAGAKADAKATTPCIGFGVGWFGISAQCSASAAGCAETNGCGTCTNNCSQCFGVSAGFSCNVSVSGNCS